MTRKTRKKRSSRKKTQSRTRKLGGKQISLLGNNADLNQVIRKLNDVIMLCCHEGSVKQTESESPGRVLPGLDPRMLNFSPASSAKKKAMPRRSKRLAMKMVKAEHKQLDILMHELTKMSNYNMEKLVGLAGKIKEAETELEFMRENKKEK